MEKPNISQREAEILKMISQGLNSQQIADGLFISRHTVNTHRKNILKKLQVNSTTRAIVLFMQQQIDVQQVATEMRIAS